MLRVRNLFNSCTITPLVSILVFSSFMTFQCVRFISFVFFLFFYGAYFFRQTLVFSSASFISVSLRLSFLCLSKCVCLPRSLSEGDRQYIRGRERACGSLTTSGPQPWFKVCVSVGVVKITSLSHTTKTYHMYHDMCVSPAVIMYLMLSSCHGMSHFMP